MLLVGCRRSCLLRFLRLLPCSHILWQVTDDSFIGLFSRLPLDFTGSLSVRLFPPLLPKLCPAFSCFGSLFLLLCRFLYIDSFILSDSLGVGHVPDLHHVLYGSNQEHIGIHILECSRRCAYKPPINIDRAAAHTLQDTAYGLNHRTGGSGQNHPSGAAAGTQHAYYLHIEGLYFSVTVHHSVGFTGHTFDQLRRRHYFRHCRNGRYCSQPNGAGCSDSGDSKRQAASQSVFSQIIKNACN